MLSTFSADFRGVAIDPRDPPRFESEAAYLRRHKLLTREERALLTPADFEPELITQEENDHAYQ